MKTRSLATCLCFAAAAATAQPVLAQGRNCGDRQTIIDRLQERYGEVRSGAGLTQSNGILEIFTSVETGSWTILITMPSGQSCLVAAGEYWEQGPGEVRPSGAPA